jgi:uncharacterized protein (DUF927 family)
MKKQFYEKVLPTQGVYCATSINPATGKVENRYAENIDDLLTVLEDYDKQQLNTFVALSSFKRYSRKADDARCSRSFFIDMDVGADAKKYPTKDAALIALDGFLTKSGLPMPVVIDSGNGVHAYWPFTDDIPIDEWKVYAEKFKAYCLKSIYIDPAVTADVSRILRCPDSFNYKSAPPLPTKFITDEIEQYEFSDFKALLGEEEPAIKFDISTIPKGLDDETRQFKKLDNIEYIFEDIAQKSVDGEGGCRQIKYMLENAAHLPEPLWHSGLSVARACVDWETAIHKMSEDYPGYSYDATVKKANATVGKSQSCTEIENRNPGGCDGCPLRGRISKPLYIGKRLKVAEEPAPEPVRQDKNPEDVPTYKTFPQYLEPFYRGANGGVYYKKPAKRKSKNGDEDEEEQLIMLWGHDFYPIKRMYSKSEGECLMLRHMTPNDKIRDFLLPVADAYSPDKLKDILVDHGVFYSPDNTKHMMRYIVKWAEYMLNKQAADTMRSQMGWTDDNDGFVIGSTELQRSGKVAKTAASPLVDSIAKLLHKRGTFQEWKTAADKMLSIPGFELHCIPLLCGFGAPLMRFTTVKGVSVGLCGRTGAAKSGSLYSGVSMFGEPHDLCLSGAKDGSTLNALTQWYMGLKNIMMGLDEASNHKPEDISNLMYKVTQGKNKLRLQMSVNAVREIELTAATITVFTTNQSLTDKVSQFKANPDGELARYIEFQIEAPAVMDAALGKEIFDAFRQNYGHAGPEYIAYLFKAGEEKIQEAVNKWGVRFSEAVGKNASYRFFEALVSSMFAGAELAIEAGVINAFDIDRLFSIVAAHIIKDRQDAIKKTDYMSVLGDFMAAHSSHTLVIKEDSTKVAPHGALVARIEADDRMYYVSRSEIKKYLTSLQISEKEFVEKLEKDGHLVFKGKKRMSTGWSGMGILAPVSAYGFKDIIPENFFDDAAKKAG